MEASSVRMRVVQDSSHVSPNTGLEDSMQRLELGDKELIYPERPGEPDCMYFLRNGSCGYGDRCRFNHPRGSLSVISGAEEYPDRPGHPICEFYVKNRSCKFGSTCKYHHPKQASTGPVQSIALNSSGYPLRMGEKECTYYIKTGNCKYGQTCKYHHPEKPLSLPSLGPPAPPPVLYQSSPMVTPALYPPVPGLSMNLNLSLARFQVLPRNYGPVMVQQGLVPSQTWNPYMGPMNPLLPPNTTPLFYNLPQQIPQTVPLSYQTHSVPVPIPIQALMGSGTGTFHSEQRELQVPSQRPNQTVCHHFLNKGYCKYGTSCKYHHLVPFSTGTERSNCALSPLGLPLRPGAEACGYYAKHGVCKYGPTCKFDHPMGSLSYTPSASSLSDVPVTPYPLNLPYNSASGDPDFFTGTDLVPTHSAITSN